MTKRNLIKFDATDKSIGRLASAIAVVLNGKNKAIFQNEEDCGDNVLVENIDKAKFTGKKLEQKVYYSYSGYPGGIKTKKMNEIFANNPGEVLERAVREMLAPNKLRINKMKRLIIK